MGPALLDGRARAQPQMIIHRNGTLVANNGTTNGLSLQPGSSLAILAALAASELRLQAALERTEAARRVADLLHDMRIHLRGVRFASYAAVQAKWQKKMDDRKQKAGEAQFKKDMDDIDNAEDEEPKAKRPKRSCTKTRRGGSA